MKQIISLFSFFCAINIFATDHYEDTNLSQGNGSTVFTAITDANFETAINTCLTTNPADGMCSDSEYGAMPTWDVSRVTDMSSAFKDKTEFNADLSAWDVSNVTSMGRMFSGATSFNGDISDWDVSQVTNMNGMFSGATAFNSDLNNWVVADVTNMDHMFSGATAFNGDISSWDVSSMTDMRWMFSGATSFNGDISSWDVSQVTDMSFMFYEASSFNQDLSSWDVSQVTDMWAMFYEASSFNQDLSSWDVSSMTDMRWMFLRATSFNGDISTWDVRQVTSMYGMFAGATSFNGDISTWDVRQVTSMTNIFDNAGLSRDNYDALLTSWSSLTLQQGVTFSGSNLQYCTAGDARQSIIDTYGWILIDAGLARECNDSSELTPITDINFRIAVNNCLYTNPVDGLCSDSEYGAMPEWDVSQVTDMSDAFTNKSNYNGDISAWDVRNVTGMYGMFSGATSFNGDISSWDVSSVTNMQGMFINATSFNGDISAWDVSSVTDMGSMFYNATSFNGDISSWDVSSMTDMRWMFSGATSFNGDISAWDVSNVTDMSFMFYSSAFNQDISSWDVSNVTSMGRMFSGATSFNGDISSWDVSQVTDMSFMFYEASSFNQDLSSWDVSSVTSMSGMFDNAGLSSVNYDKLLNGWSQKNLQQNVYFGADGINYCNGDSGRQKLIDDFGWIIYDGGLDCPTTITDANIREAVNTCLASNPEDGMCSDSEYGAMPNWDVSQVTDMYRVFYNAASFNGDISAWDVSQVTDMYDMFYRATAFNGDISAWDVSQVTDMFRIFDNAGLSRDNYDKLLNGWTQKNLQQNVSFGAVGINYCNGASGRQKLIDDFGWTITDGGLDCSNLSVEDENLLTISIYPNPVIDKLFIQGLSDATKVSIYNILGKEVLSIKNTNNINVQALPRGMYVIRISDGMHQTNRKFIKN